MQYAALLPKGCETNYLERIETRLPPLSDHLDETARGPLVAVGPYSRGLLHSNLHPIGFPPTAPPKLDGAAADCVEDSSAQYPRKTQTRVEKGGTFPPARHATPPSSPWEALPLISVSLQHLLRLLIGIRGQAMGFALLPSELFF